MAARSIASPSLNFGLVSIPVKVYPATESAAAIRFNLLDKNGARVRQQYVSERDQRVVERAEMLKGYEFEPDRFVTFTGEELKALEERASKSIEIVAFIPEKAIDPIYYDRAYFLAPDKRGGKPYALLMEAMRESGRCALARWAWKGKQHVMQVRPGEDGLVLQQLLYADEVRSQQDLHIESVDVNPSELKLALQLIEQISTDHYDPAQYHDEEKQRILAAIDQKIAGKQVVEMEERPAGAGGGEVIDLVAALRASLGNAGGAAPAKRAAAKKAAAPVVEMTEQRKGPRRAKAAEPVAAPAPAPRRARSK
jgi:DNA end-binding protein Ku